MAVINSNLVRVKLHPRIAVMNLRALLIVMAILTAFPTISPSQVSQSWEPTLLSSPTAEFPKATIPKRIMGALKISGMEIVFEETKISDVKARFGGTVGHRGDAGDSLGWLCYEVPTQRGRSVLWFLSSEIDGGTIGGFQWLSLAPGDRLDPRCQLLSNSSVQMPIPIHLDDAEREAMRFLGAPSARQGDLLQYVHEANISIKAEPYTVTNTLYLLMKNGVVKAIEVWKSTVS